MGKNMESLTLTLGLQKQLGADANKTSFKWNDNWWENVYDGSLKNVKTIERTPREESTTSSDGGSVEKTNKKIKKEKKSKKKSKKTKKQAKIKRVVISDTDSSDSSK